MNMSPHPKLKERIVEAGAFKPLVKLLKDEDGTVQEFVKQKSEEWLDMLVTCIEDFNKSNEITH